MSSTGTARSRVVPQIQHPPGSTSPPWRAQAGHMCAQMHSRSPLLNLRHIVCPNAITFTATKMLSAGAMVFIALCRGHPHTHTTLSLRKQVHQGPQACGGITESVHAVQHSGRPHEHNYRNRHQRHVPHVSLRACPLDLCDVTRTTHTRLRGVLSSTSSGARYSGQQQIHPAHKHAPAHAA